MTVFERYSCSGGLWHRKEHCRQVHNALPGHSDCDERQAAIYDDLEANTLKGMTALTDNAYGAEVSLFPSQRDILLHLQIVADGLKRNIVYDCEIQSLTLNKSEAPGLWALQVKRTCRPSEVLVYNGVVIANGHHERPWLPDIDGLAEWRTYSPDAISHSSRYQKSCFFKDQVRVANKS